jgi:hypothetical protein
MAHAEITPTEQADRLAIRELIDAYAQCADTRDAYVAWTETRASHP